MREGDGLQQMPQRSRIAQLLLRYLPDERTTASPITGVSVGISASIVAMALRVAIDPFVEGVPFITYFPMLALASIFGGLWGGVTSLVVDTVINVYVWLPPLGSPHLYDITEPAIWAFVLSGGIIVAGFWALDEAVAALRRSEQRSALVAREMQHRVKNVLHLVLSLSSLTARDATSVSDHQARLGARLEALARASDAPRLGATDTLDLEPFLFRLLDPFGRARFRLRGPLVAIPDSEAFMLGLAVHELATNAVKYGALSLPTGRVGIAWKLRDDVVTLRWKEKGGPPVIKPTKKGFGSRLLDVVLRDGKGGAELHFDPSGLVCVVNLPAATSHTRRAR